MNNRNKNNIMRKILEYGFIAFVICFCSCEGGEIKTKQSNDFDTIIVEDCEYLIEPNNGYKSMTHKGNCNNPIHNCR